MELLAADSIQPALIDGAWMPGRSGTGFEVLNPATGRVVARVSDAGAPEARLAIRAAAAALITWKMTTARHRSEVLYRWYELIRAHTGQLAELLLAEQGKVLAEARGEVLYAAEFVRWFAEEGSRVAGQLISPPEARQRLLTRREPVGVVAAITPWNFPLAMITRKVAPALAAGCTVVVKPSEYTPLCALALARLATEAGIPPGVLNVLPTLDAKAVGRVLTTHPAVKKVSFTGSRPLEKY